MFDDFADVSKIVGANEATGVHYYVGKKVRTTIEKIDGAMPEGLSKPEKSIQEIGREQMAGLKAKAKKGTIMFDV